jgi:hypothetical protein
VWSKLTQSLHTTASVAGKPAIPVFQIAVQEVIMRRFIPTVVAALFSAVTFSAYAADDATQTAPPAKQQAKKKKSKPPTVEQSGNPMDKSGQGAPQSSGTGDVKAGGETVNQPGRADPTPSQGAGGVTSPTPQGAGRGDNQ